MSEQFRPERQIPNADVFSDPDAVFHWCDEHLRRFMDEAEIQEWWLTTHPVFETTPFSHLRKNPNDVFKYVARMTTRESFDINYEV